MRLRSGLLLALLLTAEHNLTADILYSVTDLGTFGGCCTYVYGINNAGQVGGNHRTADGPYRAFLYRNGQMTDLGTLGGHTSAGLDINNAGQVGGSEGADKRIPSRARRLEDNSHSIRTSPMTVRERWLGAAMQLLPSCCDIRLPPHGVRISSTRD